jgi:hypothetical protein
VGGASEWLRGELVGCASVVARKIQTCNVQETLSLNSARTNNYSVAKEEWEAVSLQIRPRCCTRAALGMTNVPRPRLLLSR